MSDLGLFSLLLAIRKNKGSFFASMCSLLTFCMALLLNVNCLKALV